MRGRLSCCCISLMLIVFRPWHPVGPKPSASCCRNAATLLTSHPLRESGPSLATPSADLRDLHLRRPFRHRGHHAGGLPLPPRAFILPNCRDADLIALGLNSLATHSLPALTPQLRAGFLPTPSCFSRPSQLQLMPRSHSIPTWAGRSLREPVSTCKSISLSQLTLTSPPPSPYLPPAPRDPS
jgi:hypothetical protein